MELMKMKKITRLLLQVLCCSVLAASAVADTFFELTLTGGQRQADIFRKAAPQVEDDANFIAGSVAAYRTLSTLGNGQVKSAWGGVVEIIKPLNRDDELPGNGQILGLRPVNYLRYWGANVSTEFYFGAAQYRWIKHAMGYYLGANARWALDDKGHFALMVDYKYFQDLIHDGGPGGDQVVDGPSLGLGLVYRF